MAREKKKVLKQRRLKRSGKESRSSFNDTMSKIFTANDIAEQMNELERMTEEKLQEKVSKKRVRRIKTKKSESCPLSPGVV